MTVVLAATHTQGLAEMVNWGYPLSFRIVVMSFLCRQIADVHMKTTVLSLYK